MWEDKFPMVKPQGMFWNVTPNAIPIEIREIGKLSFMKISAIIRIPNLAQTKYS